MTARRTRLWTLGVLWPWLLAGCASSLGPPVALQEARLEIGQTHKSQVAELLGFPSDMKRDRTSGGELWAYRDKPRLSAIHYAVPTSPTSAQVHTEFIGDYGPAFAEAALVCVFDDRGVLRELRWKQEDR